MITNNYVHSHQMTQMGGTTCHGYITHSAAWWSALLLIVHVNMNMIYYFYNKMSTPVF